MKDIDKIIHENRKAFDSYEPSDGHFERFESLLKNKNNIHTFKIRTYRILRFAAVILLAMVSSLWVYEHTFQNSISSGIALHEVSKEYKEVEFYYTSQINNDFEKIKNIHFTDNTQKTMLLNELSDMDTIYKNLKYDLKSNPNDERIINAMIEHYQTKVAVMNQILNQLQNMSEYNKETNTKQVNI